MPDQTPSVSFTLQAPRRARFDVLPFVILYVLGYAIYFFASDPDTTFIANVAVPILAGVHLLTFLTCHWSLSVRCAMQLRRVRRVTDATHVRIWPVSGRSELCELQRRPAFRPEAAAAAAAAAGGGGSSASSSEELEVRFEYRKRTYIHTPPSAPVADEGSTFTELQMPVGLPLSTYLKAASGLRGEALQAQQHKYGSNSFAIPAKTFGPLFVEHALAPFFVFQIFCVVLWSLDDYWYYSLFTLLMLVIFESTVVTARLRNLDEMRELATPACAALVYRDGKWRHMSSEDLLPGDLVSLARAESTAVYSYNGAPAEVEAACPADVVLLHGSVTVNESALTGESTPMLKSPLSSTISSSSSISSSSADASSLSLSGHRASIVLGGTKLLQHTAGNQPSSLQPPGGGAVGYVLRTGFYSSQGELIRTILFASERGSENGKETLVFILLLLSFAVMAAGYVLHEGMNDPSRSKWKLVLHCVMILTSVVPPELPMELSLAVNNSLLALHKLHIYCTEPFRIPFAGKCHVCCFDKTGTLTLSELVVEGVALLLGGEEGEEGEALGRGEEEDDEDGTCRTSRMVGASEAPLSSAYVLAGCHSLIADKTPGRLLGDPMEKAALDAAAWAYHADGTAVSHLPLRLPSSSSSSSSSKSGVVSGVGSLLSGGARPALRILKRFPFSSELKRSAAIIETTLIGGTSAERSSAMASHPALMKEAASGLRVVAKGSPEAVRKMLAAVPDGYDQAYRSYAATGKRVLALATKRLVAGSTSADANSMTRAEAECGLTFCGFLVLHCPPRPESKDVLEALSTSGHTLMMLTGDSLLTATHTASSLGMATKPPLLLRIEDAAGWESAGGGGGGGASSTAAGAPAAVGAGGGLLSPPAATRSFSSSSNGSSSDGGSGSSSAGASKGPGVSTPIEKYISRKMERAFSKFGLSKSERPGQPQLKWSRWEAEAGQASSNSKGGSKVGSSKGGSDIHVDPPPVFDKADPAAFRELARTHDLCVDGDGFAALEKLGLLGSALPHLRVLARVSPSQKETALKTLGECGLVTLMCGDGTNDVGALRQSDVSIALVSASLVAPPPPPPLAEGGAAAAAAADTGKSGKKKKEESAAERQQRRLEELRAYEAAQAPSVKLGDASVAAAFTVRSANVTSCVDIITQGRCTLVTTTQMFKILSLNCLISAYGLSVLHGAGVRISDTQATAHGLTTAACFLFVSFAQPLPKLAPQRPPPSALSPTVLLSIGGQFSSHLYTIIHGFRLALDASTAAQEPPAEPDGDFEPSITNTVVFLLSAAMLLITFATNYTGKPFMGSLGSNKGLAGTLTLGAAAIYLLATNAMPDVSSYLELVPLPEEPSNASAAAAAATDGAPPAVGLGQEVVNLLFVDAVTCFAIEKGLARLARF